MLSLCNLCLKLCDVCRPGPEDWHLPSEYKRKDMSSRSYLSVEFQRSHSNYPFIPPSYCMPFASVYIVITSWTLFWNSKNTTHSSCHINPFLYFIVKPDNWERRVHTFCCMVDDTFCHCLVNKNFNVLIRLFYQLLFLWSKHNKMYSLRCLLTVHLYFVRTYLRTFIMSRGRSLRGRMIWWLMNWKLSWQ